MKRFLNRKLLAAGVVVAGILTVAGTCTLQKISLTTIGTNKVFAGAIQNDSGVSILDHNVAVAFIGTSNNLLETKIVQPCLRTLPNGSANYFSAQSSFSASSVKAGLARVNFDSTFKVGTPASGSGTITNLAVNRGTTTLTVGGTFKNTDSTTLTAPNACAVVFDSSGNVIVVGLDQTLGDLVQNATDTFSITLTVPDSTTTVSKVNVYVDGYKDNVPILPVSSIGNTPSLTPTATATPSGTPGAAVKLNVLTTIPTATHDVSFGNVQVAIQDANGLTVTGSTANVTLAIDPSTGTSGAALICTNAGFPTIAAVNGVATFTGCNINLGGISYRLKATASGLSPDFSNSFNVNAGTLTSLFFTTQPGAGVVNSALSQQPVVEMRDVDNVKIWNNSTSTVTLTITGSPAGVTLACAGGNSRVVSGGIATFSGCNINKVGNYQLRATVGTTTVDNPTPFDVFAKVVFTTQPSATATAGVSFATQPVVTLQNGDGTTMTGDSLTTVALTLQVLSGTGSLAGCIGPVTAASGIVTFAGCNITAAGSYRLIATSSNGATTTSTTITVS